MGTNYYAKIDICKCCNRPIKELHIGKSSGGWVFTLHYDEENNLTSWDAWKHLLTQDNVVIRDEYANFIPFEQLNDIVTKRKGADRLYPWSIFNTTYTSFEDECEQAGGVPGPNNLVRHAIGRFCVAHGEGTWDLVKGEFS